MRMLFVGGTGIISSACSDLALGLGHELFLLNRGLSSRPIPAGARQLKADIGDSQACRAAIGGLSFDAVVDFRCFTPDQARADLNLFGGRVGHFVFISSASAYRKPPLALPIVESNLLENPFWSYSRDKIACEKVFLEAYAKDGFPVTVVRPSHTYDKTLVPMDGGWTVIERMRQGKEVLVLGDGTSLWTLTNHRDFAKGLIGLLGNPLSIGEAFHITGDEWLTWNMIFGIMAKAAGAVFRPVHVPSDLIAAYAPQLGQGLLGDKSHSLIFDNSKIRRLVPGFVCEVPFHLGAQEIVNWYDAEASRRRVDTEFDGLCDRIIAAQKAAYPA